MLRFTILLPCAVLAFGVTIAPAHAQAVRKLTKDNIHEFIEKTSAITSGKEQEMTDEEIAIYLDEHLHPDSRFKSIMRYAVPGFEVQEKTMSVSKKEFIEGIQQAGGAMEGYQSQIEISDINISRDGRKATLKTRTLESGEMPVRDEIEQEEVPVEGISTCTQILMLSKNDIIQMYNASCVTEIVFQTFEP